MKLDFVSFEVPKKSWAHNVIEQYQKKISPFFPFSYTWIKSKTFLRSSSDECRSQQSAQLKEKLDTSNYLILFDERGKDLDSRKFAQVIERAVSSGKQKTQFIVGGHYGVDDELRQQCNEVIKLSPMVLNQEIAIATALEQVYRAFTIINNLPYHND